jgi:Zn-dependent metalloprotease
MIFNYTQPLIFIKVLITHVLLLVSVSLYAQRETAIAKEYLRANAKTWGLTANDLQEMKVSSAYLSPSTGWFHIYFNQYYQSIPVYNSVLNVTVKDEQVIHVNNSFVSNTNSSSLNNLKGTSLTPKTALQKVAAH